MYREWFYSLRRSHVAALDGHLSELANDASVVDGRGDHA